MSTSAEISNCRACRRPPPDVHEKSEGSPSRSMASPLLAPRAAYRPKRGAAQDCHLPLVPQSRAPGPRPTLPSLRSWTRPRGQSIEQQSGAPRKTRQTVAPGNSISSPFWIKGTFPSCRSIVLKTRSCVSIPYRLPSGDASFRKRTLAMLELSLLF